MWVFSFFLDPPEIEIEQSWYQPNGEKLVEVELLCTVHANPEAEVIFFSKNYFQNGIEFRISNFLRKEFFDILFFLLLCKFIRSYNNNKIEIF